MTKPLGNISEQIAELLKNKTIEELERHKVYYDEAKQKDGFYEVLKSEIERRKK